MAQQTIGFIGLGIMGRPMAKNLIKAGYPLVVHSRSRGPVDELVKAGAKAASSPKDVASQCDVLITMLPNSPDVEQVALGKDGIIEGAKAGLIFVDMSTISPIVSQKIGKTLEAKGVKMLDAPVSGGEKGAIDGALSIMAGGDKAVFDTVLPIFQAMGKTITYLGPLGFGGFTKLANQIIVAVNLTAARRRFRSVAFARVTSPRPATSSSKPSPISSNGSSARVLASPSAAPSTFITGGSWSPGAASWPRKISRRSWGPRWR